MKKLVAILIVLFLLGKLVFTLGLIGRDSTKGNIAHLFIKASNSYGDIKDSSNRTKSSFVNKLRSYRIPYKEYDCAVKSNKDLLEKRRRECEVFGKYEFPVIIIGENVITGYKAQQVIDCYDRYSSLGVIDFAKLQSRILWRDTKALFN